MNLNGHRIHRREQRQATVQRRIRDTASRREKKKRVFSLRGKPNHRSGGHLGHQGETLRQAENPDRFIDHVPKVCHRCCKEFPEGAESGPFREASPRHAGTEARGRGTQDTFAPPRLRGGHARDVSGERQRQRPARPASDRCNRLPSCLSAPAAAQARRAAGHRGHVRDSDIGRAMVERVARSCRRAVMPTGIHLARCACSRISTRRAFRSRAGPCGSMRSTTGRGRSSGSTRSARRCSKG